MRRAVYILALALIMAIVAIVWLLLTPLGASHNPFNLAVSPDPDGEDVQNFSKVAADRFPTRPDTDENANAWSKITLAKKPDSIDGAWASRWKGADGKWTVGSAFVQSVKDRVYILYVEPADYYHVEARRVGDTLTGRFININIASDTSPFVARIVDNTRIDGVWLQGRWDFHRQIAK